jgi:uncharacterized membrane protein YdbT with pleckstrin-like domain
MSYADGLLATGERVVHREKQHWLVFVWGAKWPLVAVLGGLLLLFLTSQVITVSPPTSDILGWVAAALVIGGLALFGWHVLRYLNHEYVLTNRRVIQVEGVLNKRAGESSLEKINDAELSQSVFGRIFDFGDLDILTASESGVDRFRMLQRPIQFKRAMLDAKHEYEQDMSGSQRFAPSPPLRAEPVGAPSMGSPAPVTAGVAPMAVGDETVSGAVPGRARVADLTSDEVTRTLASLADLRDRGAISAEEYERKKTDLLARL